MSIAAKITRLFDFVAGTRIKSADVDAELNQLVTQHNNLVDDVNAETGTAGIADGAVTTAKIADGAVTAGKLDPTLVQTDINLNTHRTRSTIDHPDGSVTPAKLSFAPALYKNGSGTFSSGGTTCTVTDAFITATTQVIVSPDPAVELVGSWSVVSTAGSFTITSSATEAANVGFDWGATK